MAERCGSLFCRPCLAETWTVYRKNALTFSSTATKVVES